MSNPGWTVTAALGCLSTGTPSQSLLALELALALTGGPLPTDQWPIHDGAWLLVLGRRHRERAPVSSLQSPVLQSPVTPSLSTLGSGCRGRLHGLRGLCRQQSFIIITITIIITTIIITCMQDIRQTCRFTLHVGD